MRKQQVTTLLLCGFIVTVFSFFPGSFVAQLTQIMETIVAMLMILEAARRN